MEEMAAPWELIHRGSELRARIHLSAVRSFTAVGAHQVHMHILPITNDAGVLAVLCGVCAFFYWLERATKWRLLQFLPPLIFIYLAPVVLSNVEVIPVKSPVYDVIGDMVLPAMLTLLLLNLDIRGALRVMGRGVFVMLFGTLGVVIGAPVAMLLVGPWLEPESWKAFGALAGSWIGGTGNMAGVGKMLEAGGTEFGLAVLADTTIYIIWLPILLLSKRMAGPFARFSGVASDRVERMEQAAIELRSEARAPSYQEYLYLLFVAFAVTAFGKSITGAVDAWIKRSELVWPTFLGPSTCEILLVTTAAITLSFTRLRGLPGSRELGMALVFLFVARMGATADLTDIADQAVPFLAGALVWIFIHGLCCLVGAKLLGVDIHTAAIASAANIGGAASASIVAAYHRESLVPASILMALIGYAVGNYGGWLAGQLCKLVY
jgi:uncharacterized membrane protein